MIEAIPGARVVQRPVPISSADAGSEAYYRRCRQADIAQVRENRKVSGHAHQSSAAATVPAVGRTSPLATVNAPPPVAASPANSFDRDMEAGAATAHAYLSGEPSVSERPRRPEQANGIAAEARGADEAHALIAIAGQPGARREDAPGVVVGADAAAGAAEARRLLAKE